MFRSGKFYKHKLFLDVCFMVYSLQGLDKRKKELNIGWFLNRPEHFIPMGLRETIVINQKDVGNYKVIG